MNRTLLSLAIIRTNWKFYRYDFIDNFVPLFAGLIKLKGYEEINLERISQIQSDFCSEYGLVIPSNPIQTILNRLSKRKYIIRRENKFIPDKEKLKDIDLTSKSNQISREFEHVTEALRIFALDKHKLGLSTEEIENGLICYLKKHDLDLLFAAEKNSLLPNINPDKKLQYVINEFIGNAFRKEPQLFQFILNLTIGHALSATILFEDFNKYSGKFKGLSLFLDTPLLFNLIGIHGSLKKSLAEELIKILNDEGVKLFVLEITQREITSNLEEAFKMLERGKNDPTKGSFTFKACLEHGFNENDIEQIILNLPEFYKKHHIENTDIPNYDDFRQYQIDEEKLYSTIVDTYAGIPSIKKKIKCTDQNGSEKDKEDKINNTIFRDVQVLSGVYRYRMGNTPKTLKDCKYLFITTNSSLAHASRRFEKLEQNQRFSLPTCLTDVFLGTLIWLHSPAKLEALNQKKIIADSFAALKPDEKLIVKYLDDVEKLHEKGVVSEENYILLRTHRAAINILENKTFGDIEEFTSQTTEEVLAELLDTIKGAEREKYLSEIEQHEKTKSHLKDIERIHSDILQSIRIQEQKEAEVLVEINTKIQNKSEKKASMWLNIIMTVVFLIFALSVIILIFNQLEKIMFPKLILVPAIVVTGILNLLSLFDIKGIKTKFHLWLNSIYAKKFKKGIEEFGLLKFN